METIVNGVVKEGLAKDMIRQKTSMQRVFSTDVTEVGASLTWLKNIRRPVAGIV